MMITSATAATTDTAATDFDRYGFDSSRATASAI